MSILNTARMGASRPTARSREYCRDIWRVEPVPIELDERLAVPAPPGRRPRAPGGRS